MADNEEAPISLKIAQFARARLELKGGAKILVIGWSVRKLWAKRVWVMTRVEIVTMRHNMLCYAVLWNFGISNFWAKIFSAAGRRRLLFFCFMFLLRSDISRIAHPETKNKVSLRWVSDRRVFCFFDFNRLWAQSSLQPATDPLFNVPSTVLFATITAAAFSALCSTTELSCSLILFDYTHLLSLIDHRPSLNLSRGICLSLFFFFVVSSVRYHQSCPTILVLPQPESKN